MIKTNKKLSTGALEVVENKEMKRESKPKRPPRTPKERAFVKLAVETLDPTGAVMQVYDVKDANSARAIASQNFQKLSFPEYFEKFGFTQEAVAAHLAQKTFTAKKRDHFSGEYEDDHAIQLKALELGVKLGGWMPKETGDTTILVNNQPMLVQFIDEPKPETDFSTDTE